MGSPSNHRKNSDFEMKNYSRIIQIIKAIVKKQGG